MELEEPPKRSAVNAANLTDQCRLVYFQETEGGDIMCYSEDSGGLCNDCEKEFIYN